MFMIAVKSMNTFFLDSLVQERFFHKNHGFKILSVVIKIQLELIIVLNLKRIKCLSQPFHVSGWQTITQEANPVLWRKFYCCYSPTYPTQNIYLFGLSFSSFLFFGLLRRPLQIYSIWLIWLLQKVLTRSR